MNQKKAKMLRKAAKLLYLFTRGELNEKDSYKTNKKAYKDLSLLQKECINATSNKPTLP